MHRRIGKRPVSLRRGVTLVELCIVLALISVVTVMVTSFTVLTRSYAYKASRENGIRLSLNAIEHAFDTWVSAFDDVKNTFSAYGNTLSVTYDGETECLSFNNENKRFTCTPGKYELAIDFEVENVESVSFSIEGSNGSVCLIKCEVTYILEDGVEETIAFLRATRAAKGGD
ncbi:MAG: prepilin-type N-terminal cleavage/methylation domain-containing protein [Clostridia bacterium]|nr:prepilin-type N-terminal cleavage/methylation domain-containing protein [Clostridia bacterium]